jgi:predicted patatin/cPLA2 family phospholipase
MTPLALLRARRASGSKPGHRTDNAHLAMVLEGGGMRGVVSIAMASEFEHRGYTEAFDSVHGSSAGACGAAYFAAGQADYGARIYFEDINNKRFIDMWRPLRGAAIMDKAFLVEDVMVNTKPLRWLELVSRPGFLNIVATAVATGISQEFDTFESREELLGALKASICLPLIAGHTVTLDGTGYVDGGIVQQIALESAAGKGATHAVVLMTRSEGETERPVRRGAEWDALMLRAVYGEALYAAYRARNPGINAIMHAITNGTFRSRSGGIVLVDGVARKSDSTEVSRLCTDSVVLKRAYAEGRARAAAYLDGP